MISSRTTGAITAAIAATALLAGCAGGGDDEGGTDAAPADEAVPHGYVEGAEETAGTQPRLVLAESATGRAAVLDLTTEDVVEIENAGEVTGMHQDGRFAYLASAGDEVHVVDGGSWTVDHGDHVHHYRAPAHGVGSLPVGGPAGVHGDASVTALTLDDGSVHLLDRAALDDGRLEEAGTAAVSAGAAAVPFEGGLLVPTAEDGTVEIREQDGGATTTLDERCEDPRGQALTRRGAVLGCADGALLVTHEDGTFDGVEIPYPDGTGDDARATAFTHRPGSDVLAARAGDTGVWTLDLAERTWQLVETGPVLAASTAGDGSTLLVLTEDGVLHAHDSADGNRTASTPLLSSPPRDDAPAPVIETDTTRAYVNDPAARTVHEIDYNDDLRVARTFELDFAPDHMVETGR
ncbi:hypothetical protein [Streptomyces marincola]|uniref:hypothetical protein n=1 Tax=Streptomyces marincola TaxID=2878388 RepID=UPI001CF3F494|nr:hypothetical protein [Streptomyces marincola]UCM86532.1 hypothetical protein LC193_00420 [Streptomyces marincola]